MFNFLVLRWNSDFLMVDRILEQINGINIVLSTFKRNSLCLSRIEIDNLKDIRDCLKPFFLITNMVSTEKILSSSFVIPSIFYFENCVQQNCEKSDFKSYFKSRLNESLKHFLKNTKF